MDCFQGVIGTMVLAVMKLHFRPFFSPLSLSLFFFFQVYSTEGPICIEKIGFFGGVGS